MEKYPESQSVDNLLYKLEQIELEVRTPIPVNESVWTKIFGESKKARANREKEQQRKALALREQRATIISAFIPPDSIEGMLRLAQIAIASYPSAPTNAERQAWRIKLDQCVQLIEASVMDNPAGISNLDVKLAYLRGELQKIEEKEREAKALAVREVTFTTVASVGAILLAPFTFGASVFAAVVGILVYWLVIRKLRR